MLAFDPNTFEPPVTATQLTDSARVRVRMDTSALALDDLLRENTYLSTEIGVLQAVLAEQRQRVHNLTQLLQDTYTTRPPTTTTSTTTSTTSTTTSTTTTTTSTTTTTTTTSAPTTTTADSEGSVSLAADLTSNVWVLVNVVNTVLILLLLTGLAFLRRRAVRRQQGNGRASEDKEWRELERQVKRSRRKKAKQQQRKAKQQKRDKAKNALPGTKENKHGKRQAGGSKGAKESLEMKTLASGLGLGLGIAAGVGMGVSPAGHQSGRLAAIAEVEQRDDEAEGTGSKLAGLDSKTKKRLKKKERERLRREAKERKRLQKRAKKARRDGEQQQQQHWRGDDVDRGADGRRRRSSSVPLASAPDLEDSMEPGTYEDLEDMVDVVVLADGKPKNKKKKKVKRRSLSSLSIFGMRRSSTANSEGSADARSVHSGGLRRTSTASVAPSMHQELEELSKRRPTSAGSGGVTALPRDSVVRVDALSRHVSSTSLLSNSDHSAAPTPLPTLPPMAPSHVAPRQAFVVGPRAGGSGEDDPSSRALENPVYDEPESVDPTVNMPDDEVYETIEDMFGTRLAWAVDSEHVDSSDRTGIESSDDDYDAPLADGYLDVEPEAELDKQTDQHE